MTFDLDPAMAVLLVLTIGAFACVLCDVVWPPKEPR